MADDLAMAAKILDVAGLELTDAARGAFETYLAGNPRGKDGRVVYDLRGDFGIDPADAATSGSRSTSRPSRRSAGRCTDGRHPPRAARRRRASRPRTGDPAVDLGDDIWMSPGLSNSYLLAHRRRAG